MAASLRLSAAALATPKSLLIEGVTPRRGFHSLAGATPQGVRSGASLFQSDLEFVSPKSCRSVHTPTSLMHTPKTPNAAAVRLLSTVAVSIRADEEVASATSVGYPCLLGNRLAAPIETKRRVSFAADATELAEGAHAEFLAKQERIASRNVAPSAAEPKWEYPTLLGRTVGVSMPGPLGCPPAAATVDTAGPQRNDAHALAESARAAFMAKKQRVASRNVLSRSE